MSLTDGTHSASMRGGIANESLFEGGGILDAFLDRTTRNNIQNPTPQMNNAQTKTPAKTEKAGSNLQKAFKKIQGVQKQTTKLQENKITSASGQGARRTGNEIKAKTSAVKEMKAAINEVKAGSKNAAPSKEGTSMKTASATAPETTAAVGAGTFGASGKSEFTSAADKNGMGGYETSSSGHNTETIDVMAGASGSVMTGKEFDAKMAQGPGFGSVSMGMIRHGVEPALEMQDVGMDKAGLNALEDAVNEMDHDVQIGSAMFQKWENSSVAVTETIGNTPMGDLKLTEKNIAELTSDKPIESPSTAMSMNAAALT